MTTTISMPIDSAAAQAYLSASTTEQQQLVALVNLHLKNLAHSSVITEPVPRRRLGEAKGMLKIAPDFEEMPEEWMRHFR